LKLISNTNGQALYLLLLLIYFWRILILNYSLQDTDKKINH